MALIKPPPGGELRVLMRVLLQENRLTVEAIDSMFVRISSDYGKKSLTKRMEYIAEEIGKMVDEGIDFLPPEKAEQMLAALDLRITRAIQEEFQK